MKEPSKKHKAKEIEDRISKLPESLISKILSFLAIKDAARTSVLSKKWIHQWASVTKLDLDDSTFCSLNRKRTIGKKISDFINFVNRALLVTNGSSMESISLVVANNYGVSLLNTWITHIMNRRVKNLRICCSNFELPFSALTSHSLFESYWLEEIVLKMFCSSIKVPNRFIRFEGLKSLDLCGIIFTIDPSACDSYRSLRLPVLNKFTAKNCNWICAEVVTIEAPLLETIFIDQNLKSVSHEPRSCAMIFCTSHLKEFTYCGYGISQLILLSTPHSASIASAKIILNQCENSVPETESYASSLLGEFSQVKCIKFDGAKVLTQQDMAVLPKFTMLSHLEICFVTGEVLLGMLQNTPVLKTLVTKEICAFNEELLNSPVVPSCLESTLQVVKFEKVHGSKQELFLAKFFMENGVVLERMSFSLGYYQAKSKIMEEFKEKLFSYKKGFSSFAIVDFSS